MPRTSWPSTYKSNGHIPYLRNRRGRWLVQVPVPKSLQSRFGKTRETYLRTGDRTVAKIKAPAAVAEILASFERARNGGTLTSEEMKSLAEAEMRRTYDALASDFLDSHGNLTKLASEVAEDASDLLTASWQPNRLLGKATTDYAEEILDRIGAEKTEQSIAAMTEAILKAQAAAIAMLERGMEPPALNGRQIRRNRQGTAPKISEAGETFLTERQRDKSARLTTQTENQMRATFRLFRDYTHDAPLDTITRDDAAKFLDTIAGLHPHYGRRPGASKQTLSELLEKYSAGDGNGLSNKTLNRHQSALKTLFRWARKRGMVDGENPFADLARTKARHSEVTWLPYTVAELNKLFDGVSFDTKIKKHSLATDRPWIMAIALFSGMRQGEICEIETENVGQQDGVWYFDVTAAKSEAGVRRVPIHSELIKLGILDYIKTIGSGPLFPGITRSGPDKKRAHTMAKRFPAYRRDKGVDRDRVAFHSFRKCFVRALELAKVDRDRAAQVVGHERGFTFRVYNPEGVDVTGLWNVVESVTFEKLKLTTT